MTRGLFNWTFRDVSEFLKDRNFKLNYTNGSHYYYTGVHLKVLRNVCIPFHSSKIIKPRTLRGIIEQSGIPQKEWIK